jgi:hypothetical protein
VARGAAATTAVAAAAPSRLRRFTLAESLANGSTFGSREEGAGDGAIRPQPQESLTNDGVPASVYRPFCDDNVLVLVALTS